MNLYVEKCLPHLKKPYINCAWLHAHPFAWPADCIHPVKITNSWALAHVYFNFCLYVAYTVFVVCHAVQIWLDSSQSLTVKFYMGIVSVIYVLSCVVYTTVMRNRDSFLPFLRTFISFLENQKNMGGIVGHVSHRRVSMCVLFLAAGHCSMWLLVMAFVGLNILRPASPEFLSSVTVQNVADTDSILTYALATMASTVFQAYILVCYVQMGGIFTVPIILFMFTMSDFVAVKHATTDGGMPLQASLERRISHYRCLQLLTVGFNDLFAAFHVIFNGMMIAFPVMCIYGFVRNEAWMAAMLAYLGVWTLTTYLQFTNNYAEVNQGSKNVLLALRACWYDRGGRSGGTSALLMDRELSSLTELRIKGGDSVFHYDKKLVLTAMDIILKQSVSLPML